MSRFPQSSCSKFGAAIFLAREEQKFARLSPSLWGEWYEYTISSREIYEGKALFWYLVYHIAFSFRKIRRLWKSTSTLSISSEISGSSGLLKVIYLCLLPPNFGKVKPYFSRKGICLSFLWKKWLILWASEGEFLFEKLVKIFAFDRRPLNFGLKFELV